MTNNIEGKKILIYVYILNGTHTKPKILPTSRMPYALYNHNQNFFLHLFHVIICTRKYDANKIDIVIKMLTNVLKYNIFSKSKHLLRF